MTKKAKNNVTLDIRKFIIEWNSRYPYDKYIRKKYGIIFGSKQHRELNFLDMAIEYKEDAIIDEAIEEQMNQENKNFWKSDIPGLNELKENKNIEIMKVSKKQLDKDFEELDLSQFND